MTNPSTQLKLVQDKLVKTEIPVLLSKLVLNNQKEEALSLLVAWGTYQKDQQTVWTEAKKLLEN